MKWLDNLRTRYRWTWVGTVEGRCNWNHDDGTRTADWVYWNLYQRGDGKRRFDVSGDPNFANSTHVKQMNAAVRAWKFGGPVPQTVVKDEPPKPKAKLIAFSGGKDGAA